MKKTLLTLLLAFTIKTYCQSIQNGQILYKISVSKENIKKYNEKARKQIKNKHSINYWDNFYKESNYTEGLLRFEGLNSSYQLKKKLKNEASINYTTLDIFAGGMHMYFVNIIKNETIKQNCKTLGKCFLISNHFLKWELTQQIKIIKGYKCYLAKYKEEGKNKKSILAWYTNEIPTNFGPLVYSGLPGLILELDDGTLSYKVRKIKLNIKKKITIEKQVNGISITNKEFIKMAKKSFPKELFNNN